jgi:hypothetical protein
MMDYELAEYLLASLPPEERAQTVASLRRANAAEFRRMRAAAVSRALDSDEVSGPTTGESGAWGN